jgi:hypothetical protein
MSKTERFIKLYKKGKISKSTILKMSAFKSEVEEFLKKDLEKTSSWTDISKGLLIGALIAPTVAASNYLLTKGISMAEELGKVPLSRKAFERMLEYRPELKSEDQLLVKKY